MSLNKPLFYFPSRAVKHWDFIDLIKSVQSIRKLSVYSISGMYKYIGSYTNIFTENAKKSWHCFKGADWNKKTWFIIYKVMLI